MNESEDIMENEDILENDAFDEALNSLDEQLDAHNEDPAAYDENQQDAIMYEEGVEYTAELDEKENPEAVSYAEQANDSGAFESHEPDATEELVDDVEETFEEYPTYEEEAPVVSHEEEVIASEDAHEDFEEVAVEDSAEATEVEEYTEEPVEEAPAEAPVETSTDAENSDFNLSTLTQLVDEIREESQRVAEMKSSVAEALQLIQEMSESLKS